MGVEYYLMCEEKRELFDLGRMGSWFDFDVFLTEEGLREGVESCFSDLSEPGESRRGGRLAARHAVNWCAERDWKVKLTSDAGEDWEKINEWETTGSLYDYKAPTLRELRRELEVDAEELRHKHGLDRVTIIALSEDVGRGLSSVWGQELLVVNGRDVETSGFRRVVLPGPPRDEEDDEYE